MKSDLQISILQLREGRFRIRLVKYIITNIIIWYDTGVMVRDRCNGAKFV